MPERGGAEARASRPAPPRFRRADRERLVAAAARLVARGRLEFPSQEAFLTELRAELARLDPLARIGPRRLRRLMLGSGLLRLRVTYTERAHRRPLGRCPVCGEALAPVVNQTLYGDRVTLGYACRACGYWTHLHRRVPIRYAVRLTRGAMGPPPGDGPRT